MVGVDEAGRGACAGPLVVAACVLRPGDGAKLPELADSKSLTPLARDRVYERILRRALDYSIVVIPPAEIDVQGVHTANIEGMRRAVAALSQRPGYVLLDGFRVPGLPAPSVPVLKGDRAVACVAAASVLAKVQRDKMMAELGIDHADFGFADNAGYPSPVHKAALEERGTTPHHRLSWAYLDALPQWRHLKKVRSWVDGRVPEIEGQLGFDF